MASPPELTLVPSYAHKTNPTLDGLPEEIFVNILEFSVTFDKLLHEVVRYTKKTETGQTVVLACDKSPPLPLSILLVNKAIYRFAIKAFYKLNRFAVRFENIRVGSPGAYLVHCLSRLTTDRPPGLPASLDMTSIRKLGVAYLAVKGLNPNGLNPGSANFDEMNLNSQPVSETLLTYLIYLPNLKSLIVSFSTATEFLALWKYVQTYQATATGIGEITIPGADGRHHVLRFPDLAEAWEELSNNITFQISNERPAKCLIKLAILLNAGAVPSLLYPFLESDPLGGGLTLRLQRRPGEPKRFLAFNLALVTYIMTEESGQCLRRNFSILRNVRWDWSEGDANDQIPDSDETPDGSHIMYNRSMTGSQGWYGDADWSGNEILYNQLCTPIAANGLQTPQVLPEDGQHTGEKWLRSFWKSQREYAVYCKYSFDMLTGMRDIIRFGGVLRR